MQQSDDPRVLRVTGRHPYIVTIRSWLTPSVASCRQAIEDHPSFSKWCSRLTRSTLNCQMEHGMVMTRVASLILMTYVSFVPDIVFGDVSLFRRADGGAGT